MRFLNGLLAIGAVAISAFVTGSAVAPTKVSADSWARLDVSCPSGSICRETHCYESGSEQCTAQYCVAPGCS